MVSFMIAVFFMGTDGVHVTLTNTFTQNVELCESLGAMSKGMDPQPMQPTFLGCFHNSKEARAELATLGCDPRSVTLRHETAGDGEKQLVQTWKCHVVQQ